MAFDFWFDEKLYTVQGVETMLHHATKDDMSTIRSEYTRMRDAAQKRLKRLQKEFPNSAAVREHAKGFAKLRDMDKKNFSKAFAELAKFLKAKTSTVSGQKDRMRKTISAWRKQGLDLNERNYKTVMDVLEEMRFQKIVYGSDTAVEFADIIDDLDSEAKQEWLMHMDDMLTHANSMKEARHLYDMGYTMQEIKIMLGW